MLTDERGCALVLARWPFGNVRHIWGETESANLNRLYACEEMRRSNGRLKVQVRP
jgi:hypothetical protein